MQHDAWHRVPSAEQPGSSQRVPSFTLSKAAVQTDSHIVSYLSFLGTVPLLLQKPSFSPVIVREGSHAPAPWGNSAADMLTLLTGFPGLPFLRARVGGSGEIRDSK
jgi:hypothetical protein